VKGAVVAWPSWSEIVFCMSLALLLLHLFVEGLLVVAIVGPVVFCFLVFSFFIFYIFGFVVFWGWLQSVIGRFAGFHVVLGFGVFSDWFQSVIGTFEIFGIVKMFGRVIFGRL
jgi:hypothetical protein